MRNFKVGDKVIYDDGKFKHKAEVVGKPTQFETYVVRYKYNGEEVNAFASFDDLKHADDRNEWAAGDHCVYDHEGAVVVGWHPEHPVLVVDSFKYGLKSVRLDEISKPETQEQKSARERDEIIERALDHCSMSDNYKTNLGRLLDAGILVKKPQ